MTNPIDFAHSTVGNLYTATALKLKLFNRKALTHGYNRSISDEGIKLLDNRAINLIQLMMPLHTNYAGKNSVRVLCYMKMKNHTEPKQVFLDISHEDWMDFCEKNDPIKNVA
jgi:hypothetical protein